MGLLYLNLQCVLCCVWAFLFTSHLEVSVTDVVRTDTEEL